MFNNFLKLALFFKNVCLNIYPNIQDKDKKFSNRNLNKSIYKPYKFGF